jgi:hypothetical protein
MSFKKFGFKSYSDYLKSHIFKKIKEEVFNIHSKTCICCKKEATQIHHMKYTDENILGKNYKYLVPICGKCHYKIEFNSDGSKTLKLSSVNKKLKFMMSKKDKLNIDKFNSTNHISNKNVIKSTSHENLKRTKSNECFCCKLITNYQYDNYPICVVCNKEISFDHNGELITDNNTIIENIHLRYIKTSLGPKARTGFRQKGINLQSYDNLPVRRREKKGPKGKIKNVPVKKKKNKPPAIKGKDLPLVPTCSPKGLIKESPLKKFIKT